MSTRPGSLPYASGVSVRGRRWFWPQTINLKFAQGLDQSENPSELPLGFLADIKNWEVTPLGNLRVRRSWSQSVDAVQDSSYKDHDSGSGVLLTFPTRRRVCGMFFAPTLTNDLNAANPTNWLICAFDNPDHSGGRRAEMWGFYMGDDTLALGGGYGRGTGGYTGGRGGGGQPSAWPPEAGWYALMQFNATVDAAQFPFAFCKANTTVLWTHPFATAIHRWNGARSPAEPILLKPGDSDQTHPGQALAFYKGRIMVGGEDYNSGAGNPWTLFFSDLNSTTSWPSANSIAIAKPDGQAILDLAVFNNNLMIGKQSGLFLMSGGGPSTYNVVPVENAQSCQGRSLISTPLGLVILGDARVWLWAGGTPQDISQPIQAAYAAGMDDWRMGTYCDGRVYIAQHAAPHTLLVFDLLTKTWWIEDVADALAVASLVTWNKRLWAGQRGPIDTEPTNNSLTTLLFRDFPVSTRAAETFRSVVGTTQEFRALTPRFTPNDQSKVTVRHLYLRLRQLSNSVNATAPLVVQPYWDGIAGTAKSVAPYVALGDQEGLVGVPGTVKDFRLDFGKTCRNFQFAFSHDVGLDDVTFDVEELELVYDPLPPR